MAKVGSQVSWQTSVGVACIAVALLANAIPATAQTPAVWTETISTAAPFGSDFLTESAPGAAFLSVSASQDGISYLLESSSTSFSAVRPVAEVQGSANLSFGLLEAGARIAISSSVRYAVQPMPLPGAPAGVDFVPVSVSVFGEASAPLSGVAGAVASAQGTVQQQDSGGGVDYNFRAAASPDLGTGFDTFSTTYNASLPTGEETFFFVLAQGVANFQLGVPGSLSFHAIADPEITISDDLIPGTAVPYSDAFEMAYSPNLVPEPATGLQQVAALVCISAFRRRRARRSTGPA